MATKPDGLDGAVTRAFRKKNVVEFCLNFRGEEMNYSKKANTERNSDDGRKRVLDYMKSGPVKGENEIAVQKNLSEVLKIDLEEVKRIIASLAKEERIENSPLRAGPFKRIKQNN